MATWKWVSNGNQTCWVLGYYGYPKVSKCGNGNRGSFVVPPINFWFLELDLLPILAVFDIPFTSSHSYPWTFDPLVEGGFSQIWQHNRKDANTFSYWIFNQMQNICLLVSFTGILPPNAMFDMEMIWSSKDYSTRSLCFSLCSRSCIRLNLDHCQYYLKRA